MIFVALLGFILTDLFSSLGGSFNSIPNAGTVGGETISLQEFSERYQNQLASYPGNLNEAQRNRVMDDVWNAMVAEIAFRNEFEHVGLEISGDEILDMFTGENIHPIVRQYFVAPDQEPDPAQIRTQLQQLMDNSESKAQLRLLEDFLAIQRKQEVYRNMIQAGYIGSKAAARQNHIEQNRKVDIEFLGVNYTQIPDSQITVSDREMRAYMTEHEEEYQQEAATYLNYVKMDITPSAADSASAFAKLTRVKTNFRNTDNDSSFQTSMSRVPFRRNFRNILSLSMDIRDSIRNAAVGEVFGPVMAFNAYKLYKLVEKQEGEDTFVKFRHIMITPDSPTPADSAAAARSAGQYARQANDDNFADLVNEYSRDFASKRADGVVDWYGESGRFGPEFWEEIKDLGPGRVYGPIKSNSGYHAVEILDRTQDEYILAEVEAEIFASSDTRTQVFSQINQLADLAQNQLGSLDSAAQSMGLTAVRSNPLENTTLQITGLNGGREVILWALKADEGDFSEVFQVENAFVYGQVVERQEKGLQSLDDVRPTVYTKVANEKKAQLIIDKLASQSGSDLNAMKEAYGQGAFVSNAAGISFLTNSIPGIGADPFVIGRVSGLSAGEVTSPIQGLNGVYVIKATNVVEAPELDDAALAAKRDQELAGQANQFGTIIQPAIIEIADVKDTRYKAGY